VDVRTAMFLDRARVLEEWTATLPVMKVGKKDVMLGIERCPTITLTDIGMARHLMS
jgi:hypothetical protein